MTHIEKAHDLRPAGGVGPGWTWFVALGCAFVVLGLIAGSHLLLATVVTVYYLGCLMVLAAILQVVQSFRLTRWSGFFLWLLSGLLYAAAGAVTFMNPALASAVLTLFLALFIAAAGIARIWLGARAMSESGRGWIVASGILSTGVGLVLLMGWPVNSAWVLGLVLAIDLIVHGGALIGIGVLLRTMR